MVLREMTIHAGDDISEILNMIEDLVQDHFFESPMEFNEEYPEAEPIAYKITIEVEEW